MRSSATPDPFDAISTLQPRRRDRPIASTLSPRPGRAMVAGSGVGASTRVNVVGPSSAATPAVITKSLLATPG